MKILKVGGHQIKAFFDCNAKFVSMEKTPLKFNEKQEEMKIQNTLISQKISKEFFVEGIELKGDENPLLVIKNRDKIDNCNIHQHLSSYDQVVHGTKYLSKNITIGSTVVRLQERVDMIVNTLNPHNNKMEIKAFTFFYGEGNVKTELTFKDMLQHILLSEEYPGKTIHLHRVNLKTNSTHIQTITDKDYFQMLRPILNKMVMAYNYGPEKMAVCEDCKVCPYYDYCGIKEKQEVSRTENVIDKILSLEAELKQLKEFGKKFCEINDSTLKSKSGEEYGLKIETSKSFAGYRGKKHEIIEEILDGAEPDEIVEVISSLKHHITIKSEDEVVNYLNQKLKKNFGLKTTSSVKFRKIVGEED